MRNFCEMFLMFGTFDQSGLVIRSAAFAWPESVVSASRKSYCRLLNWSTTSALEEVALEIILIDACGYFWWKSARLCLPIQPG